MTGPSPHKCQALSSETWEFLLQKTILYAAGHVRRWRWRGSLLGVLPDGFDPESLASEAIAEFLQKSQATDLTRLEINEVRRDLERRVRRHVNRLHHRSENRLLRNEPDLTPVTLDDGEIISITELIPQPSRQPDESLLEKESLIRFDRSKSLFSTALGKNRRLRRVFDLFCDGRSKPEDIASTLKLRRSTVKNLCRRFRRKWARFHGASVTSI